MSKCLYCQRDFLPLKFNVLRGYGKYCSRKCSSKSKKNIRVLPLGYVHSQKTRAKMGKGHLKGKYLYCEICNKKFWARPSWIKKNRRFCSRMCYRKNPVKHWLGKKMSLQQRKKISDTNKIKGIKPPECPEVWATRTREKMLEARRLLSLKRPTSLELKLKEKLDENKINHISQHLMYNKFIVDEWIPSLNTVIEVNGRYWHTFPKQILQDKSKIAYLTKCGLKVLTIWEEEIDSFNPKSIYYS